MKDIPIGPDVDLRLVFRTAGSAVRAVCDPDDPDDPDWAHEPDADSLGARCPYFWAGHHVHWIQAKNGLRNAGTPVLVTDVTGIDATAVIDGAEQTWRFHDPSLLQALLIERSVVAGSLHEPSLLVVQGRLLYPCRDPELWRPCALADLARGTGGADPSSSRP